MCSISTAPAVVTNKPIGLYLKSSQFFVENNVLIVTSHFPSKSCDTCMADGHTFEVCSIPTAPTVFRCGVTFVSHLNGNKTNYCLSMFVYNYSSSVLITVFNVYYAV